MKSETPISDAAAEMISTHRCNERMMVPLEVSQGLERLLNEQTKAVEDLEEEIRDLERNIK